jgi:hypothetical protein
VEGICGGVNSKTATAAAVWRQGHLLHFGFDLSPDEMSEAGRALLRVGADRATSKPEPDKFYVEWYFPPALRKAGKVEDWAGFRHWYKRHRAYLRADPAEKGSLVLDEDAMQFGTAPASPEFMPAVVEALKGERAGMAATLLRRYVPDGPEWRRAADSGFPLAARDGGRTAPDLSPGRSRGIPPGRVHFALTTPPHRAELIMRTAPDLLSETR